MVSLSGVVAFLVNLSIFWIIGNTSPLTYPFIITRLCHLSFYIWSREDMLHENKNKNFFHLYIPGGQNNEKKFMIIFIHSVFYFASLDIVTDTTWWDIVSFA